MVIGYWFFKQETPKAEAVRTSQRDNAVNRAMEESQTKASSSVSMSEIESFLTFP